jgi:hypothetical protein
MSPPRISSRLVGLGYAWVKAVMPLLLGRFSREEGNRDDCPRTSTRHSNPAGDNSSAVGAPLDACSARSRRCALTDSRAL